MQTFGAVASRSHPCRPVSASILIWLAGFPTDFLVVAGGDECTGDARSHHGIKQFVAPVGRIIAREFLEQAAPIEPCGTRLDIVRIAGFDMAGDLLQRRCPITANATKTADWLRILQRTISCRSRFLSESFASACKRAITLCR